MGRSPPLPHHPQCRRQRGTAGAQYARSSGLINTKKDDAAFTLLDGTLPFRGASAGNLLRFPEGFDRCRTVPLIVNYRSHPDVVGFYDGWMSTAADWSGPEGGAAVPVRQHGNAS